MKSVWKPIFETFLESIDSIFNIKSMYCRHSTWISRPSNGNLSWIGVLVWCRIQWIVPTNMAVYIANRTANALVSSSMFATKSDLCAPGATDYRASIACGKQTTKLRCHNKTKHRRNKHRIEQYSRLEKSIFPVYGSTDATAARHQYSITIGSLLGTFRRTRSTKWYTNL